MQEKLKELGLLISQLLSRQKEEQAQNAVLKQRVRILEESALKLKDTERKLKELSEWKKNAQIVLRRLVSKIDKELDKVKQDENRIV